MKFNLLLSFTLTFIKGNAQQSTIGDPSIATDKLDTLKGNHYTVNSKPEIFETAFFKGTEITSDKLKLKFFAVDIGNINIESGKIIACDPINLSIMPAFEEFFPIGNFPVQLSVAEINGDHRVAFARIAFSDKPVVNWKFALMKGQKDKSIFGSSTYAYSVDGAIAYFIDEKSKEAYANLYEKNPNILDSVDNEMNKHLRYSWQYAIYTFGDHNLASFSTGMGDGRYSTYIGYDDKGKPCRLLTDFNFVDWWKEKN